MPPYCPYPQTSSPFSECLSIPTVIRCGPITPVSMCMHVCCMPVCGGGGGGVCKQSCVVCAHILEGAPRVLSAVSCQMGGSQVTATVGAVVSIAAQAVLAHRLVPGSPTSSSVAAGAGASGSAGVVSPTTGSGHGRRKVHRHAGGVLVHILRLLRTVVDLPSVKLKGVLPSLLELCLGSLRKLVESGTLSKRLQPPFFLVLRQVVLSRFRYFVTTGPPQTDGRRPRLFTSPASESHFVAIFQLLACP